MTSVDVVPKSTKRGTTRFAPGGWVKTGIKYSEDEVLARANPDGSKSLIEIRIAGTARAIVLDQTDGMIHYSALQR